MLRWFGVALASLVLAPAAQAALSVSAAVEPGAHAATFTWTTSGPARVTVEVGRTADYGIWLRTPARAHTSGRALLGSLEPLTAYRYRVTARSGRVVVRAIGTFTTRAFPDWTVGAVIDSTLHVDGQPFFPRMVYGQCDWAYAQSLSAGVNLYMGSGCSTPWVQLDALARACRVRDPRRLQGGRRRTRHDRLVPPRRGRPVRASGGAALPSAVAADEACHVPDALRARL